MNESLFPAKVDWGVSLLLAGLAVLCFGFGIACFFFPAPSYIGGVLLLLTGALLQSVWMRTNYKLDELRVRIQCGPFWWTIPLRHITQVEKTSSIWLLMGGPHLRFALSKEGLMIRYRRPTQQKWFGLFDPSVLISPADRDQFFDALLSTCPNMTLTKDGNLGLKA
ncbi:PH domain-containing protein [Bremerella alba]|uniref:Uncharacterized protein YyaB-like PH domain-containing protein n=1 Tax=Bremerella alba TaxID=980252 RepID=A0A7V8V3T2_9BACT|nr:PH domain-containing protein [Bremerella alba]MBA2114375.1 hypothetical protein [Bremerella alba]